jgi:hypothetical protein
MQKANVYVIGTCRAFGLARESISPDIILVNRGDIFYHSTKEMELLLDYNKRKGVPRELRKYLKIKSESIEGLKGSNIVVIEVSSSYCAKIGDDFFKLHGNNLQNNKYNISSSEMKKDLRKIIRRLQGKKIIFIPHINIIENDEPIISSRQRIVDILISVITDLKQDNIYFFNPADYIPSDYLQYVDEPIYHYTERGRQEIGAIFKKFLEERVM